MRAMLPLLLLLCLATLLSPTAAEQKCVRTPARITDNKSAGDNGFKLDVMMKLDNGSKVAADGYIPGHMYYVKLEGHVTSYTVQTFRAFSLVAHAPSSTTDNAGKFAVSEDDSQVRMSPRCDGAVAEVTLQPKTQVVVQWKAPKTDVGCVEFKAMVVESRRTWYMDDGALTKRVCVVANYLDLIPDDSARECCACDDAKYEIMFDGLWSRETHPKDFPSLVHLTHFSDLVGASHSAAYHMWAIGAYASDGLKELAEWGNTFQMEQEMKQHAKEIRTIIKARGLWYPNVEGDTKASFRVDKYHHLMSLASMLGPSPDWLVGVSDVNLCLTDCSWVDERSFDLYPFDAGTDGGVTYMSPNNPSVPREKISLITTKQPADVNAPFYQPSTDEMPPLARLIIKRQKVYPMECKTDAEYQAVAANATTSEDEEYKDRRECMVGEWTPWSLCSATCGKGIRMRSRTYKLPVKAQMFDCQRQNTENQFCNAPIDVCEDSAAFNEDCAASAWTEWTACSVTCEYGLRSRTRNYMRPERAEGKCSIELAETERCMGAGGEDCSVTPDPLCQTTYWSDWSPCTASCGEGMRVRTRLFYYPQNREHCAHVNLLQEETCNVQTCERFYEHWGKEICQEEKVIGQCSGVYPRFFYDTADKMCKRFIYTGCKGNRNRFETEDQCKSTCVDGYHADQKALEWWEVTGCVHCCIKCQLAETEEVGAAHVTRAVTLPSTTTSTATTTTTTTTAATSTGTLWAFYPYDYYVTAAAGSSSSSSSSSSEPLWPYYYQRYSSSTAAPSTPASHHHTLAHSQRQTDKTAGEQGTHVYITATIVKGAAETAHTYSKQTASSSKAGQWLTQLLQKSTDLQQDEPAVQVQPVAQQYSAARELAVLLGAPSILKHYDKQTVPAADLMHAMGVPDENIMDGGAAVDCMVTEWSSWSDCSSTCGSGKRTRTRSVKVLPRNGGRACPFNMRQKRRCQMRPCPNEQCRISQWSAWTQCSASCDHGSQSRYRHIIKPRGHHLDMQCTGATSDYRSCKNRDCLYFN